MSIFLNIMFGFVILLGILFTLYFLLNIIDFYGNQRELHLRIIFKDKMTFICAALLIVYMAIVEITFIGMALFFVLLINSFIFNVVMFSRDNMLIFNSKFKYESIELVTIKWDNSSSKKFISFKLSTRPQELMYILRMDDIDYIVGHLERKNVNIKQYSR